MTIKNKRILIISDMHIPFQHEDTVKFLRAVKRTYEPDRVVCIGDELDHQAMKFHDSDSDLPSAGHELQQALEKLKPTVFPIRYTKI